VVSDSHPVTTFESMKFYRVVLTGGPCAGKTSALAFVSDHFRSLGWKVYIVQEAATIFLGGGIAPREITTEQVPVVQKSIVKLMMCLEDSYRDLVFASMKKSPPEKPGSNLRETLRLSVDDLGDKGDNCLVISDRGVMDASVYCDQEVWQQVLTDLGLSEVDVKDLRYDCIIHLVTAAQGAEPFYTLASNAVRIETIDEARAIDQRTMKAWIGHPYFTVVDNSTGFKEKVVRAVSAICKRVGVPELDKSILKRKFFLKAKGLSKRTSTLSLLLPLSSMISHSLSRILEFSHSLSFTLVTNHTETNLTSLLSSAKSGQTRGHLLCHFFSLG
jgi:predicted ATPase